MNKKDLKIGYVVELRSGVMSMVMPLVGDKLALSNGDNYCSLHYYSDDLTQSGCSSEDIIRIYGYSEWASSAYGCSTVDREKLWTRPKEVELTLDQIADKFGISVGQLKIKK